MSSVLYHFIHYILGLWWHITYYIAFKYLWMNCSHFSLWCVTKGLKHHKVMWMCQCNVRCLKFKCLNVANQNWQLKIPNPVLVKAWVGKWKCESTIEAAQSGLDLRPVHNSQLDHKVKVVWYFAKNTPPEQFLNSCNKMSRTLLLRVPLLFMLIELRDISTPI